MPRLQTHFSGVARRQGRLEAAKIHRSIQADPDIYATDEAFWKDAREVSLTRKPVVIIRLDSDLLEWFLRERGYQTEINAILRTYRKAHATKGQAGSDKTKFCDFVDLS